MGAVGEVTTFVPVAASACVQTPVATHRVGSVLRTRDDIIREATS